MTLNERSKELATRVIQAEDSSFSKLAAIANLDPRESFVGCDLRGADFSGSILIDFNFRRCDLRRANWSGATFNSSTYVDDALLGVGNDAIFWDDFEGLKTAALEAGRWNERFQAFALLVDNFGATHRVAALCADIVGRDQSNYSRVCAATFLGASLAQNNEIRQYILEMSAFGNSAYNRFRFKKVLRFADELRRYLAATALDSNVFPTRADPSWVVEIVTIALSPRR